VLAVLLLSAVVYLRWKQGHKSLKKLFLNWSLLLTLILCFIGVFLFYRYWGIPAEFEEGEIGILVTELPGDVNRQQQAAYARAIRIDIQRFPELTSIVRVRTLDQPLPTDPELQQVAATKIGRRLHATFVLRPFAIEGIHEPLLNIIDQPGFGMPESPLPKFKQIQLPDLDTLPLPHDLELLARCTLAVTLTQKKAYREAARELQIVLSAPELPQSAPSRPNLYFLFGEVLSSDGQLDSAIASYKKVVDLQPDNGPAHYRLGFSLAKKNKLDDAITEYHKALTGPGRINFPSGNGEIAFITARGMMYNGLELNQKGLVGDATAQLLFAIAIDPDYAEAYSNLAGHLANAQPERALAYRRRAVELDPGNAFYHEYLSQSLEASGKNEEAKAEHVKAESLGLPY